MPAATQYSAPGTSTASSTPPTRKGTTFTTSTAAFTNVMPAGASARTAYIFTMESMASTVAMAEKNNTSRPSARGGWAGMSAAAPTTTTSTRDPMVAAARDGMDGIVMMRAMLTDIATMIRPPSAADAPTVATKKSCHGSIMRTSMTQGGSAA